MRRGAPLLVAVLLVTACGGGDSVTYSPQAVRDAFRSERLELKRPHAHPDDAYVHLEAGELYVDVFPTVDKANEWADLLYQPVGLGTLVQPRPMHRTANVVVAYDPGFTDDGVEDRVRRAMRELAKADD